MFIDSIVSFTIRRSKRFNNELISSILRFFKQLFWMMTERENTYFKINLYCPMTNTPILVFYGNSQIFYFICFTFSSKFNVENLLSLIIPEPKRLDL